MHATSSKTRSLLRAPSGALILLVAFSLSGAAFAAPTAAAARQGAYQSAYALGLQAYIYGLPLLETHKTFVTQTSVTVSNGDGYGPVNTFNNVRNLTNPDSKTVVAPGSNGLSSIAWLDLTHGPEVLHVPRVRGHSFVLALLDPYTTNLRNLGTANSTRPGYYAILGPGQHGMPLPPGTGRIDVDYSRIWIIGSTQLKGRRDLANVHRIQDGYTLTSLAAFVGCVQPPGPPARRKTKVRSYSLPQGLRFFDVLGRQLALFPPPARDRGLLSRLAQVGIGPGKHPSHEERLGRETRRGLAAAVADGPATLAADAARLFRESGERHNGYFVGGFGRYGTNYKLRAVISQIGLGAFTSEQTIYALSLTDAAFAPLAGSTPYVLRMPSLPPVNGGWSLTVYSLQGFLVHNPIGRYELSSGSRLARGAHGSVEIYLQSTRPASAAAERNWLPTPANEGFEVIWRLLAPKPAQIGGIIDGRGWQPPKIVPAG